MTEDLKFHFSIATLLREGDLIVTAAETHADVAARLPAGYITAGRTLIGAVVQDVNNMKNKKGGIGALTQEQNADLADLNKWINRAKQTALLAFKGQTVKLREQFQIGVADHFDLASILTRANVILGNIQDAANLAAFKAKGWIDADTNALAGAIGTLAAADTTQEAGKGGALDTTGIRNHDANLLYEHLLIIQNAADLEWPDDSFANAGIRIAFRLDLFPPRGGATATTTATTATAITSTPVAK